MMFGWFVCIGIFTGIMLFFLLWIFFPPLLYILRQRRESARGFDIKTREARPQDKHSEDVNEQRNRPAH
jgi:hypothetical protein